MTDSDLEQSELERVRAFMVGQSAEVAAPLTAHMIVGGRSNITYALTDGVRRWVLRRPPFGAITPSAHDVVREHTVIAALANSDVPVAAPVGICEDLAIIGAPFSVAEFVEGQVIRTRHDLAGLSGAQVEACVRGLVKALVSLHATDVDRVGLGSFARRSEYGKRQLRTWSGQWERVITEPRTDAAFLASRLMDCLPRDTASVIVHGDFRIDNVILDSFDPGRVLAVVDWELCTLGDPVADVAQMCAYRAPALDQILGFSAAWSSPDLPTVESLASAYESISGRSLENWEFFLGLAFYKLAVISEGIKFRYLAGATRGEGFASAGEAVPELLSSGIRALDGR